MLKRILADIILFASLVFAPWYWTAVLAVVGLVLFRKFWEIIALGFLIDALYSLPVSGIIARFGFFTIASVVLFLITNVVRKELRT